jgi:hypothetical protein
MVTTPVVRVTVAFTLRNVALALGASVVLSGYVADALGANVYVSATTLAVSTAAAGVA